MHLTFITLFLIGPLSYLVTEILYLSFIFQSKCRCANTAGAPVPSTAAVCPNPVSSAFLTGPSTPAAAVSSTPSQRPSTLTMEQTQLPGTGTRKAKVLYDYDAHDASELSLLADEVQLDIMVKHTHIDTHTNIYDELQLCSFNTHNVFISDTVDTHFDSFFGTTFKSLVFPLGLLVATVIPSVQHS